LQITQILIRMSLCIHSLVYHIGKYILHFFGNQSSFEDEQFFLRPPVSEVYGSNRLCFFFFAKYGKTGVLFHFCRECAFLCTTNRMRTLITWRVRSGAHPCVTGATALLRSFPSFLRHPYRVSRSSRTTIDNATQGPLLAPARTPHVRTLLNLSPCYSHNAMS